LDKDALVDEMLTADFPGLNQVARRKRGARCLVSRWSETALIHGSETLWRQANALVVPIKTS
jgi:hypothetical protein